MTFSEMIKNEFASAHIKSNCCRRAFILGVLFDAQLDGESMKISLKSGESADYIIDNLNRQFAYGVSFDEKCRAGRKYTNITLNSTNFAKKLGLLSDENTKLGEYCEFKCKECRGYFLRGIFLTRGTATLSAGSNHFEYRIVHGRRAKILADFLSACSVMPKIANRDKTIGLYYKNGGQIEDNLILMNSTSSLFYVMNERIEGDIKKNENRAVNCEAINISKSVEASQRHIKAIKKLRNSGALEILDRELQKTAALREENPEMSLSELCELFEPRISKSVLNSRLTKILREAEKTDKK